MENNVGWFTLPELIQAQWRKWVKPYGTREPRSSDAFSAGWHAAFTYGLAEMAKEVRALRDEVRGNADG